MDDFLPGQRWISESESELGVGTVTERDARCVHIHFPATGEDRIYSRREAPLARVGFAVGDRLKDQSGRDLLVKAVHEQNGLRFYDCEDIDGNPALITEADIYDHMRLNRPEQKLLGGRIDRDIWFTLRYQTWLQGARLATLPVHGLVGARMGLIPHQLYIAAEVSSRLIPRVLLADEVGLGKTIEAGLILHRLLLSERAQRVLIVVPDTLLYQWLVEMLRRFNLRFSLFDEDRFEQSDSDNPFLSEQRVLCSLDFLTSKPEVAKAALAAEWDLLVVDEAHHLAWDEDGGSLEYQLIATLAEQVLGVLLLSATPEQLGRAGHFGRLHLLDPHRFHDYQAFLKEEAHYAPLAEIASRLLDGLPLDEGQQRFLDELLGADAQGTPEQLIERLMDRHGTGRVLFRNTRSAISGFPQRRLLPHPLPACEAYAELSASLTPESEFGSGWSAVDPRVDWLAGTLRELRPDKVLVICAHAETAIALGDHLHAREGIHGAVFHEGMSIIERDRAAAYFADPEEGTQVLICSEIGSEGRNFQFAHHLVLFDLPLEPDLLEQRIGRLDRIGQTETVCIHVPYLEASAGQALYRWYAEGLNAFEQVCPAASAVFEELHEPLLMALADPARLDPLIEQAAGLSAKLNQALEAGRDRLLELHSHRPEVSARLVEAIRHEDADLALRDYIVRYWDAFGVEHEPGPSQSAVLHPGNHMLHEHFPGLPDDGLTVTFDRDNALAHEDREFLTWEHPMVISAMDMLSTETQGSSALTAVRNTGLKPGTLMLEIIYVAECVAPPALEIRRFLPPTAVRLLIDANGNDRSAEFEHEQLVGECLTRKRKFAANLIKSQAARLVPMLKQGEVIAHATAGQLQAQASERMSDELGHELERLRALARVNPSVREDEIEQLQQRIELLEDYLQKTHLRLDALRMVVAL